MNMPDDNDEDGRPRYVATCSYDREAILRPDFPMFQASCRGCAIRALAAGPLFHQSGLDGSLAAGYKRALVQLFGDEWRRGHDLVKTQHEEIKLARASLVPK